MVDSRESSTGEAELVGRDKERETLAEAFADLRAGRGRLLLISGEAGIGKTALIEHFSRGVQDSGVEVRVGACYDMGPASPYSPWIEALRDNVVSGDDLGDASLWVDRATIIDLQDQATLFNELRDRLATRARNAPFVIVLEDLHWADSESVELLRFIGRSLRSIPVMMLVTYRSDELSARHPLSLSMPNLVREGRATRVELRRFPAETIQEFVLRRYRLDEPDLRRLVAYLERRSQGNPFFLTELLRSLEMADLLWQEDERWRLGSLAETEVPQLIRQVIERRVDQLDAQTRGAIETAAVLGYELRPDLLMTVLGAGETDLTSIIERALDLHLMEQSPYGNALRFRHALVREAIYASLSLPWRQARHRQIALVLAETPGIDAATVADHFHRAADSRAAAWLMRAARDARRLYAPNAVIQHLEVALALEAHLEPEERMEAFRLRGWAHKMIGDFDQAYRDYQSELMLARETGARRAEWDAFVEIGDLWTGRDYKRAGEYVERALSLAVDLGDEQLRAHSLNRVGNWYLNVEDPDRARQYHLQALEIFQGWDDQRGIADTLDLLGMTSFLSGDLLAADNYYSRAIELFRAMDDQQGLCSSLATLTNRGATYQTDTMVSVPTTLAECVADGDLAFKIASSIGWRAGEIYALWMPGFCHGARGDYARALSAAERSVAAAREIGHLQWLVGALCMSGALHIDLLDFARARTDLEEANARAHKIGSRHWTQLSAGFLAIACLGDGAPEDASKVLASSVSDDVPSQTLSQRMVWCARIELALAAGHPEVANELTERMLAQTPHFSEERPPLRLAMLKARTLIDLRQYEVAEQWLTVAKLLARQQDARASMWRVHRLLGTVQAALGHRLPASLHFAEARRIVDEIAQTIENPEVRHRFESRANALIPASRAPTQLQTAKLSFGGLTRRQREVASLIASGSSNREIADYLNISERTVESHVTAILATLELGSRAQVAAWVVEHDLTTPVSP